VRDGEGSGRLLDSLTEARGGVEEGGGTEADEGPAGADGGGGGGGEQEEEAAGAHRRDIRSADFLSFIFVHVSFSPSFPIGTTATVANIVLVVFLSFVR
jgi:hypothetical protein